MKENKKNKIEKKEIKKINNSEDQPLKTSISEKFGLKNSAKILMEIG